MFSIQFITLLIIMLLINTKGTNGLKILGIFPVAGKSHYITAETILKALARRGHSVDVVSHFPQKEKLDNFNDINLAGSVRNTLNNLTFEQATQYGSYGIKNYIGPLGYDVCDLLAHPKFQKLMATPKGTYDVIIMQDLQKWLDESTEGCLYFSFGSQVKIESIPEKILKIFYETFERIKPIRVLLKITDANLLPDGLPKNVKISSWLPQVAVFKHNNTRAFITHGGLLVTQEAVAYKVPMIGLPLFADQLNNVAHYVQRKIAIALSIDTLTVDSLTNAVNSVLKNPIYRKSIEKISDLFWDRPISALETAVYWVEFTARHGTVLKSPATQLTWWQLNLLDVYGFITMSFLVIILVIKKSLTYLWKCVRNFSSKNAPKAKKNQ